MFLSEPWWGGVIPADVWWWCERCDEHRYESESEVSWVCRQHPATSPAATHQVPAAAAAHRLQSSGVWGSASQRTSRSKSFVSGFDGRLYIVIIVVLPHKLDVYFFVENFQPVACVNCQGQIILMSLLILNCSWDCVAMTDVTCSWKVCVWVVKFTTCVQVWQSVHSDPPSREGFTIFPVLLHPRSRGTIRLRSSDPADRPIIDPRYLTDDVDIKILAEGSTCNDRCYTVVHVFLFIVAVNTTRCHAIAKTTARCAQYMSALKIVCKHKSSRRSRKNLNITILSLFGGESIFEVFQQMWSRYLNVTDGQTDGQYCGITAE